MRKLILLSLLCASAWGTARTWIGTAGDGKWSTAGNWSPSGSVGSGDDLTFDSTCTSCNSAVDADTSIQSLTVASTYTGVLTCGSGVTLSISGNLLAANWAMNAGTLSLTDANHLVSVGSASFTNFSMTGVSAARTLVFAPVVTNQVPAMTSNTAPSGTASASSNYTTTPPWNALAPGAGHNGWLTNGTNTGWIQYQFPSATTITAYSITPWSADNFPVRSPIEWTLQGSNNGSAWTSIDSESVAAGSWIEWMPAVFSVASPGSYSYYRLNVTANGGNAYLGVANLALGSAGSVPTIAVTGSLTLQGAASKLLSLRSGWYGNVWHINASGSRTLGYLSVKDSYNDNAATMNADTTSTLVSGNTGWSNGCIAHTYHVGSGQTYPTILAAYNAVAAACGTNWSGDQTILLHVGTYAEELRVSGGAYTNNAGTAYYLIYTNNLGDAVIVDCTGHTNCGTFDVPSNLKVVKAATGSFTITGSTYAGILTQGPSDYTVSGITFNGTGTYGLLHQAYGSTQILGNTFQNCTRGVNIDSPGSGTPTTVNIYNNIFPGGTNYAIAINHGTVADISGNVVTGNSGGIGAWCQGSGVACTIRNNIFVGNRTYYGAGSNTGATAYLYNNLSVGNKANYHCDNGGTMYLYNNVSWAANPTSGSAYEVLLGKDCTDHLIGNSFTPAAGGYVYQAPSGTSTADGDYNNYNLSAFSGTKNYNLPTGQDTHANTGNPLFANGGGTTFADYKWVSGSALQFAAAACYYATDALGQPCPNWGAAVSMGLWQQPRIWHRAR